MVVSGKYMFIIYGDSDSVDLSPWRPAGWLVKLSCWDRQQLVVWCWGQRQVILRGNGNSPNLLGRSSTLLKKNKNCVGQLPRLHCQKVIIDFDTEFGLEPKMIHPRLRFCTSLQFNSSDWFWPGFDGLPFRPASALQLSAQLDRQGDIGFAATVVRSRGDSAKVVGFAIDQLGSRARYIDTIGHPFSPFSSMKLRCHNIITVQNSFYESIYCIFISMKLGYDVCARLNL